MENSSEFLDFEYLQVNYKDTGFGYLLPEILELFRDQSLVYLDSISAHLGQGDMEALQSEAHTLKGSAGSVGAAAVATCAAAIETAVSSGNTGDAAALVIRLKELILLTNNAIATELENMSDELDDLL